MSAIKQLGATVVNALKNGAVRELRRYIIGAVAAVALWVASLFLPSDPPPAPEGAVLPKKRPVATAAAAGNTPQGAAKPGDKAAPPAGAAAGKAAPKGSDKTAAKPADAAKTVAVPSKPAATAAAEKAAPAPSAPGSKAATPTPAAAPTAAPKTVAAAPSAATAAPAAPTQTVSTPRPAESTEPAAGVTIQREVYAYDGARRRDPFVSLAKPADVGPLLNELRLVGIAFDEVGRNSVAVLRDGQKGLYRVKTGQSIGRAKVSSIGRRSVTFSIDEFGATRQEVIALADTTKRGS